ncbi:AAA family ATPase [Streptomyces sp. NPDC048309]|uniref:ATP-binding protein n=1 Tax=unclassified Streptomyces TaxID=2593676 RepID=UPI0033F0042F
MEDENPIARSPGHVPPGGRSFVGRNRELQQLSRIADEVAAGTPWLAWVKGDPGIGKTTLIRHWLASMPNFVVLTARGDAAETELPYEIIIGMLRHADREILKHLPLLSEGLRAEPAAYAVGAQLLLLLGELQERGPVALVIDDIQWADQPSMRALSFLARRLVADRVLLVLISRSGRDSPTASLRRMAEDIDHFTELTLEGLSPVEIGALAKAFGVDVVQGEALARLHSQTQGHPLYARSLLTELSDDVAQARSGVPPSLAAVTRDQLNSLPEDSRRLIEALAVLDCRIPLVRAAQVAQVDDVEVALEPALAKGLVEWWPLEADCPVAITHVLQRDTIYASIAPQGRRELHTAAAAVVDPNSAWAHRVAAASRVDPELADELQAQAASEAAHSEWILAANHLLWAAQLSDSRHAYEQQLLTACLYSLSTLSTSWAARRQREIDACGEGRLRDCVLGVMSVIRGDAAGAEKLLNRALDPPTESEPVSDLASLDWIEAHAAAFLSYAYVLENRGKDCVDAASRALSFNQLSGSMADSIRYILACGHALTDGPRACLDHLTYMPAASQDVPLDHTEVLTYRGMANAMAGELAQANHDLSTVIARGKTGAKLRWGMWSYYILPLVQYMSGEWDDAAMIAERGLSIATDSALERGLEVAASRAAACYASAGRGDWTTANAHLEAAQRKTRSSGTALDIFYTSMAEAFMAQAADDPSRILVALEPMRHPAGDQERRGYSRWLCWWGPLLAEALIATGELEEARQLLAQLESLGDKKPCLQLPLARAHGSLAEISGDRLGAIALYRKGVDIPITPDEAPLQRALIQQALGGALRADGQRREAAVWLREALDRFNALRAAPYASRCEAVLGPITQPLAAKRQEGLLELTERERDIAVLVGRGLTNNEIASELLISPKTVEYHLGHIYARHGLTGRRQLGSQMRQSAVVSSNGQQ